MGPIYTMVMHPCEHLLRPNYLIPGSNPEAVGFIWDMQSHPRAKTFTETQEVSVRLHLVVTPGFLFFLQLPKQVTWINMMSME